MNDPIAAFVTYADAFEQAYAARDWSLVDRHFDDDVVWSLGGLPAPLNYLARGRDDVSAAIRDSTNHFDRRFDRREPVVTRGPVPIPGGIHMEWAVTYTRDGLPAFELRGEEWDVFVDGRLAAHHERIHNGAEVLAYMMEHGDALLPPA